MATTVQQQVRQMIVTLLIFLLTGFLLNTHSHPLLEYTYLWERIIPHVMLVWLFEARRVPGRSILYHLRSLRDVP